MRVDTRTAWFSFNLRPPIQLTIQHYLYHLLVTTARTGAHPPLSLRLPARPPARSPLLVHSSTLTTMISSMVHLYIMDGLTKISYHNSSYCYLPRRTHASRWGLHSHIPKCFHVRVYARGRKINKLANTHPTHFTTQPCALNLLGKFRSRLSVHCIHSLNELLAELYIGQT